VRRASKETLVILGIIVVFIGVELYVLVNYFMAAPDEKGWTKDLKVSLVSVLAAFPILFACWTFNRSVRQQKAEFISDYLGQLFTSPELSLAFHELVYTYTDRIYVLVTEAAVRAGASQKEPPFFVDQTLIPDAVDGAAKPNKRVRRNAKRANRFFLPHKFQLSPEERRLDSLLHFFNLAGYYLAEDLITVEDLYGCIGYHLRLIISRKAITDYLQIVFEKFQDLPENRGKKDVIRPFYYLLLLLAEFDAYNQKNEIRIEQKYVKAFKDFKSISEVSSPARIGVDGE
jgi:hypothetical protein